MAPTRVLAYPEVRKCGTCGYSREPRRGFRDPKTPGRWGRVDGWHEMEVETKGSAYQHEACGL